MYRRRNAIYSDNSAVGTVSFAGKPNYSHETGGMMKYGVAWQGIYGSDTIAPMGGDMRVHVSGPYCPDCATRLDTNTFPKLLIFNNHVWTCADCEKHYSRPNQPHLFDER